MATMLINRKPVSMTIEQKARLLPVFEIGEAFHMAVGSGTNPKDAYVVHHNGKASHYCPCKATGKCAHRVAVDWKLESQRREQFTNTFNIYA